MAITATALGAAASTLVLTLPGAAVAAGGSAPSTCFGRVPTITAAAGTERVEGTEGDDVIVAERVDAVVALGGDDAICVVRVESVDAGSGNDQVSSESGPLGPVIVLGWGSDVFEGSGAFEVVYAEQRDGADAPAGTASMDTVRTRGGFDRVYSGTDSEPNHDVVDLGTGGDFIDIQTAPGGEVRASGGEDDDIDMLAGNFAEVTSSSAFDVDLAAGTAHRGGTLFARVPGFENVVWDPGPGSVRVVGTDERNFFSLRGRASVRGAGGGDKLVLYGVPESVLMGPGRDLVEVNGYGDDENLPVVYDLGRGRFTRDGSTVPFETDALRVESQGFARESVLVLGSDSRDKVRVGGCGAVVRGGGGADQLVARTKKCDGVATTLRGGAGNDRLLGWQGRDVLLGGAGRDGAAGGAERDRCRAEVEIGCER